MAIGSEHDVRTCSTAQGGAVFTNEERQIRLCRKARAFETCMQERKSQV
jgi:hypothetical protein